MTDSRKSKLGSFIKGSVILVISNVCLKAINFFLLPLYTKYLTPSMIGVSDSITTFTGVVFPILSMGMDSAFSAFYFDKDDPDRSKKVFHTSTWLFLALGLIPLALTVCSVPLSRLLFHTADYAFIVRFALVSVSFNLWFLPYSLALRLENRMFLYGLSNMIASLSMILLNILFVTVLHLQESALVLSTLIVHAEQLAILYLMVRQAPRRQWFDRDLLRRMLRFALPLIPMNVMMWVLTLSDRYVLLYFHGSDAVGLYGIGLRFTTLLNVVISAVSMAYTTFAFSSKGDDGANRQYYYIFNIEALLLLAASFTVSLFGREIVALMTATADYETAYRPLRDLMFAQSVYAMTTIVGYGIYFQKKSLYSFLAVTSGAVLNLALNFLLIPKYGISAAALTTLLGYLLNYAVTLYFSEKVYPCEYGQLRVGLTALALYAACYLGERLSIPVKAGLWLACAVATCVAYRDIIGLLFVSVKRALHRA